MTPDSSQPPRTEQLRRASDRLATVLQSLDLEDETQLADDVIEAIRSTERAYEREAEGGVDRGSDRFVFPLLQDGTRPPRERERV